MAWQKVSIYVFSCDRRGCRRDSPEYVADGVEEARAMVRDDGWTVDAAGERCRIHAKFHGGK